jgi:glycine cleavage system H lipoate-binding protein
VLTRVLEDASLAAAEPEGNGWLLRLQPDDLDTELPNLVLE